MSDDEKTKQGKDGNTRPSGRKPSPGGSSASRPPASRADNQADRDVGHALRSVYSTTVNEDVPSELLDLLGKLS